MDEEKIKFKVHAAVKRIRASWYPASNPSLLERQNSIRRARPSKLPLWVCPSTLSIDANKVLHDIFLLAVHDLDSETNTFELSPTGTVELEWNCHRRSQIPINVQHPPSAKREYENLLRDTTNENIILFLHGGGFVFQAPSTSRALPLALSRLTGSRVCQVDYRPAPQHPFPAALFDALLSYLALLSPPSGAIHDPLVASRIVFAGESAGANLCLALLQLLLQMQRSGVRRLPFNGRIIPLHLPAGICVLSGYCDQTDSLPSYINTRHVDYTGTPPLYNAADFPADRIWPADPPRHNPYCHDKALCHPLVSPTSAKDWRGAPPMWFACGEESPADGNRVIARRAAHQGVRVVWEEYLAMPHIFPLLPGLEATPQVMRCLQSWAGFIVESVEARGLSGQCAGYIIGLDGKVAKTVEVAKMLPKISEHHVQMGMQSRMLNFEAASRRRLRMSRL